MSLRALKELPLSFSHKEITLYKPFLLTVFRQYTPAFAEKVPSTKVSEKLLYAIPESEYRSFFEYSKNPNAIFPVPEGTRWVEVEFFGGGTMGAQRATLNFHGGPPGGLELFMHPHFFSDEIAERIRQRLQAWADDQLGEDVAVIPDPKKRPREGKRAWIFDALLGCSDMIAILEESIRRELRNKEREWEFIERVFAQGHVASCKKAPCADFWRDWESILNNEKGDSWEALYFNPANTRLFRKWNITKDPPE